MPGARFTLRHEHTVVNLIVGSAGAIASVEPNEPLIANAVFLDGFASNSDLEPEVEISMGALFGEGQHDVVGMYPVLYTGGARYTAWYQVTAVELLEDEVATTRPRPNLPAGLAEAQRQIDQIAQYQQLANTSDGPSDNKAVTITVFQAQKLAAILSAARRGFRVYEDNVYGVEILLRTLAYEESLGSSFDPHMSSQEIWAALDTLPWPPNGKPQTQPDL